MALNNILRDPVGGHEYQPSLTAFSCCSSTTLPPFNL